MFMEFMKVLVNYSNCPERMLNKLRYSHIKDWMHQQLSFMDNEQYAFDDYYMTEAVHLLLNGMQAFPLCQICGKLLQKPSHFYRLGFAKGCSKECSSICKVNSFKQTCLKTYGVDHYAKNKDAYRKYCNLLEKRYGVTNSFQLESSKKQIKATKLKNHGNENYTNVEKARQTRLEHFDGKWESEEVKQNRRQTFIEHYGADHNMKSKVGQKAYEDAIEKKYGKGIRNISQAEEVKQKKVKTCQKNFGVDYPQQSPSVQKKTQQTCLQKYGYEKAMQNPDIRRKAKSKYFYNRIFFDSKPELAYYIWLTDNDYAFEYHPSTAFTYEHNGHICIYQPDFKVGNKFIEIKGDHFFKDDGTMQNPYDHSKDAIAEAKHQCMLKNNVKILRHKDYIVFIRYVKAAYGASFLQKCKIKSK